MTSGHTSGMDGPRSTGNRTAIGPLAISAAIVIAAAPINASATLLDADRFRFAIRWWEPITWQGTSAIAMVPLIIVVGTALRMWPVTFGRRASDLARHAALTVPFSLIHVVGMVEMRRAIYALWAWPYHFASSNLASELIYEWRKDCVTYLIIATIFILWRHTRKGSESAAGPHRIDVRDGTTSFSLDPQQILSVNSEGNYVRVRMDDGSHLIRGVLAKWEQLTSPYGFRRIHRSTLVNVGRVRATRLINAKDFEVTLDDGSLLRGSRRYKQYLERLA